MIDLKNFEPGSLPSVAIQDRVALPTCPCIYLAIDASDVIQYIGRTINARQRWTAHHRYSELEALGNIRIAYLKVDNVEQLPEIEQELIRLFEPPLNGCIPVLSGIKYPKRLFIGELGEYHNDLLTVDSAINNRTAPSQANALLCSKLQEREVRVKERVQYLANKRGISFQEMWNQLLVGKYQKLNPEEFAELLEGEQKDMADEK